MKHLFTIIIATAAALALTSCQDDKGDGKLDPNAKVYITAAKTPQAATTKAEGKTLTPFEIVKTAKRIQFSTGSIDISDDWGRDTINARFIIDAVWVITSRLGELDTTFITARDFAFVTLDENNGPKDTIAYIPNEVMAAAEVAIKKAYAEENYTECYRLMQEAFVFIPSPDVE